LTLEAANLYRWRVEDASDIAAGPQRAVLRSLAKVMAAAARDPVAVKVPPSLLDPDSWRGIHASTVLRDRLTNQFVLGVGQTTAPVIVMGTEAADDLSDPLSFADQCLWPLMTLTGMREDVVGSIRSMEGWPVPMGQRWPIQLAPWDYVNRIGPGATWRHVSCAVSMRQVEDLIGRARSDVGLGARCYQIERSAASALRAGGGAAPSPERIGFLCRTFLPAVRRTARVLLMHGWGRPWAESNERAQVVAEAFLGQPVNFLWRPRRDTSYLEVHRATDGRLFIWCSALNGRTRPAVNIEEIRGLVLSAAPEG
jgi:hypothetical protein